MGGAEVAEVSAPGSLLCSSPEASADFLLVHGCCCSRPSVVANIRGVHHYQQRVVFCLSSAAWY
jgi:hypothetical protein